MTLAPIDWSMVANVVLALLLWDVSRRIGEGIGTVLGWGIAHAIERRDERRDAARMAVDLDRHCARILADFDEKRSDVMPQ